MRTPQLPLFVLAVVVGAVSSACSDDGREGDAEVTTQALATSSAPRIDGAALDQIKTLGQEKRLRTPAQRKMSSQLVLAAKARRGDPQVSSLGSFTSSAKITSSGTVLVDIKADVDASLLGRIRTLGGSIVVSVPRFDAIQAEVPLDQLEVLADEPSVHHIMPALGWVTNKVDTTQGDVTHRASTVRALEGLSGNGVTVGVISDGVDTLGQRQASGDLPGGAQLQVLPGQAGDGDEGTAMLEIVHDLAPSATLLYATALPSAAQFAQNILDLRAAGADIIVDDVGYLAEAAFQDDVIAQAVDTVTADGALYFSAAGNDGNVNEGTASGYEGDYEPTTPPSPPDFDDFPDVHDFGGENYNLITFDSPSVITLQWSDPFAGSDNDYDLFLLNATRTAVVDASTGSQMGAEPPLEFIDSEMMNHQGRTLVVARWSGEPRMLRLSTHRGSLEHQSMGQIWGHAAASNAFGMAAVDVATASGGQFVGGASNPAEWFSSDGPRRIFFEADGTPLTPGNFLLASDGGFARQKPEFAAADGVVTSTPGFNPFFGTSAAAPHAAALAALLLEARPEIAELDSELATTVTRNLLAAEALDIEAAGFDRDSGAGIVMADAAIKPCSHGETTCDDGNPCTQTDACQAGKCVGSNPIVCSTDECHGAGSCDPATGECTNQKLADDTPCNDDDACTGSSSCQDGVCTGVNPVTCSASDECHTAGTCDPATGECSNPTANDNTPCDDDDACTGSSSCQAGTCTGANPVTCSASDECHTAGTCDPATGQCSNPQANDDTPCNDDDACTGSSSCQAGTCTGANPVVCSASDECHVAGTCDPPTGQCSDPKADDDTPCDDSDACTGSSTCQAGTCTGANPVVCSASDECHVAGTCDPTTGQCSNPNADDDIPCDDSDACTGSSSCQAGNCTGANPVVCSASDECHVAGTCDPATGQCSNPNA
ncbi:MAG TPA: S8 family serine peptidase, partial [Polyangiaceae bacterium]|nr:S8 family serine peptidase [Polyangiaceae bacterium]